MKGITLFSTYVSSLQENFKKGIYGLLHIVQVARSAAVKAIEHVESTTSGLLKPNLFRGGEGLIPPDVHQLLP
jgi:phage-related protein